MKTITLIILIYYFFPAALKAGVDIQFDLFFKSAIDNVPVPHVQIKLIDDQDDLLAILYADESGRLVTNHNTRVINFSAPQQFRLMQNYPNPFSSVTNIKTLSLHSATLRVFNIRGQTVFEQDISPGQNNHFFNFTGLPAGIYFARLGGTTIKMFHTGRGDFSHLSGKQSSAQSGVMKKEIALYYLILECSAAGFQSLADTVHVDEEKSPINVTRVYGLKVDAGYDGNPIGMKEDTPLENINAYFPNSTGIDDVVGDGITFEDGKVQTPEGESGTYTALVTGRTTHGTFTEEVTFDVEAQTGISGKVVDPVTELPIPNIIIYGKNIPIDTTDVEGLFTGQIGDLREITFGSWDTNVPGVQPLSQSVANQSDINLGEIVVSQLSPQQYLSFKAFLDSDDDFWERLETNPDAKAWTVGYHPSMYNAETGIFNDFAYVGIRPDMVTELTRQVESFNTSLKQIGSFVQFPIPDSTNLVPYANGDEVETVRSLYAGNFVNEKTGEPVSMWWMSSEKGTIPTVYVNSKQKPEGPHFITRSGIIVNWELLENVDYAEAMSMAVGFRGEDPNKYAFTFMGGGSMVTEPTQKDIYAGLELLAEEIFNKTNLGINEYSGIGTELQKVFILYKSK